MARYTVVWADTELARLAELWGKSPVRRMFATAANEIDAELANDPEHKGIDVGGGLRRVAVFPLEVLFEVHTDDRITKVVDLREMKLPPNG